MGILSAFCGTNRETDARAFAALMHHLYTADHREETVLMVQVENEVAMVEQPRDYSGAANKAYMAPVPQELMDYINNYRDTLFSSWCEKYHMDENPLFIPEATLDPASGVNALYSTGKHRALGFSPFGIEKADTDTAFQLTECYYVLRQLTPLILSNQDSGQMTAFSLDTDTPTETLQTGDFICQCGHTDTLPSSPCEDHHLPPAGAIIIALSSREFIVAGSGVYITFVPRHKAEQAGILRIEEGVFKQDQWITKRRLNGDESHQGRHLRLESGSFGIQQIKLYTYK